MKTELLWLPEFVDDDKRIMSFLQPVSPHTGQHRLFVSLTITF